MKKISIYIGICIIVCLSLFFFSCENADTSTKETAAVKEAPTQAELISKGKYLVTILGCNDCHSPKKMTPHGPVIDSARMLSGHQQGSPLPPIDKNALKPGNWLLFMPDLTATVGPWGISFSANLTPDSTTGIGAWEEHVFIGTIRTGKHLGHDYGRPILPPMPWEEFAQMTDEDLKAVFSYLKSLPPISNKVPANMTPDEVAKMK